MQIIRIVCRHILISQSALVVIENLYAKRIGKFTNSFIELCKCYAIAVDFRET